MNLDRVVIFFYFYFIFLSFVTKVRRVNAAYQFSRTQALQLSSVKNHSEFFQKFIRHHGGHGILPGSFDYDSLTELGDCEPRMAVISVPQPASPNQFHWPLCTLVKRCSGCCMVEDHGCLPQTIQSKTIKVMLLSNDGGSSYQSDEYVDVHVEEHVACDCQCRVHSRDCNNNTHVFNSNMCACDCKTSVQCPSEKFWDTSTCSCVCSNVHETCPRGEIFSTNTCRCIADPTLNDMNRMQEYLRMACGMPCPSGRNLSLPRGSCVCR